jgi:HEAT repeat protein
VNNTNQLLLQAQAAQDTAEWQLLIQYLHKLILEDKSKNSEILENQEKLLELALSVLVMGDFQQRWEIAKVIKHLGAIAIPPLIEVLTDEEAEEELRWYAARLLGEFHHPDAISALVELLKTEDDEELRAIAVSALGQMGTVAIATLTELLTDSETRLLAVRSLSLIRNQEVITPLLSVVDDPLVAVRATAIEALGSFHDQRIPPVLIRALDDIAAPVRREAILALSFRPELRDTLDLVTKLQPRLYDFNLEVCCTTAVALSRIGGDDAAKYLSQVLLSPHTPVKLQRETIHALSWIETPSSLEYLCTALNQLESVALCQEIVTVLGRIKQPQLTPIATEILLAMLQKQHPTVENAAIKGAIALSLGQLGRTEAKEALIALTKDADELVRLHAIAALRNRG